jgi:hypothetical protein
LFGSGFDLVADRWGGRSGLRSTRAWIVCSGVAKAGSYVCQPPNSKIVLSHNHNDSDAKSGNKLGQNTLGEVAVAKASRYRALASLYRQQAAYSPFNSWHLLGQAERWEHLAEAEISGHFKDRDTTGSGDVLNSGATAGPNDTPWTAIAAA